MASIVKTVSHSEIALPCTEHQIVILTLGMLEARDLFLGNPQPSALIRNHEPQTRISERRPLVLWQPGVNPMNLYSPPLLPKSM